MCSMEASNLLGATVVSNTFHGRGNLGDAPNLKYVTVNGEQRAVCELRVYFDRLVPDGQGGFTDRGGFWLDVSYWGERGENAARLLSKGMRVRVEGSLQQETRPDRDTGEDRSRLVVVADTVDIDLGRIESLVVKRRSPTTEPA